MILGIGIDLCRIERIRRSVTRFGKAWLDEVFTDEEQARLSAGDEQAQVAAIGFALKEACAKAIGTGFDSAIRPQDFVVTITDDRCSVRLTGVANGIATSLCPASVSPLVLTYYRNSEIWVSALAVITSGDYALNDFSSHLTLPQMTSLAGC